MRPIRLFLTLTISFLTLTLLLYTSLSPQYPDERYHAPAAASNSKKQSRLKALFSFTSPASLFPPSAIISLTDDNSTFFLSRPAAFGPFLPSKGLSGPLWIGSGFGDEALSRGELGCSDVPGWEERASAARLNVETLSRSRPSSNTEDHKDNDSAPVRRALREHADIQSIQESAEITGKIVLLKRGGCGFLDKVKWAQSRGGVAVVVGDDVRGGPLIRMYAHGDSSNITIPALFITHTTAHLLSSLVPPSGFLRSLSASSATQVQPAKDSKLPGTAQEKPFDTQPRRNKGGARSGSAEKETDQTADLDKKEKWASTSWFGSAMRSLNPWSTRRVERSTVSKDSAWVPVEDFDVDTAPDYEGAKSATPSSVSPIQITDDYTTGDQDWPDLDLIPQRTSSGFIPQRSGQVQGARPVEEVPEAQPDSQEPEDPAHHEGLWVTLTPANVSSSPIFDTLLVLVVSPLVTLTVVYALLLLRSRIRRRRWRAPKSVVERLPVRTYHTISDTPSPSASPATTSPTTPLLQRTASRPSTAGSRAQSRAATESPASSSSVNQSEAVPEEEKRESGLAEWRRRYVGRQRECVVCLEDYVDGVSQVMSLPCGHEFHVECITPWLVTRRRTCPICKGDVVRSLSQSFRDRARFPSLPTRSSRPFHDDPGSLQAQVAETHNDSPSASRPVPISSSDLYDDPDVEANWDDGPEVDDGRGRAGSNSPGTGFDLSGSFRELSSTVQTTIWRGFDAIRSATGTQRRQSHDDVDRDR
ncbi:hypothetical protein BU24DRAFT_363230 [Aaosphaeria arxii CBS 175.79]|uniref:RING-type E3 ubiquitin transferase n=1 Tax=Aaosphaeria arxii CBS 175.79 TaxID=1450172 RepID=A0A6A5Y994_9PLEO|nr:uncharacterized protein BU24DRAFT_363230 [Aaosphaeria arxii CBS 175.79]KAF2022155.1 hypothetical protein BU24DRAFT_363230 [Aaosphaeria arxii CBS 175.79]